jgi:hypothetical protein
MGLKDLVERFTLDGANAAAATEVRTVRVA